MNNGFLQTGQLIERNYEESSSFIEETVTAYSR